MSLQQDAVGLFQQVNSPHSQTPNLHIKNPTILKYNIITITMQILKFSEHEHNCLKPKCFPTHVKALVVDHHAPLEEPSFFIAIISKNLSRKLLARAMKIIR